MSFIFYMPKSHIDLIFGMLLALPYSPLCTVFTNCTCYQIFISMQYLDLEFVQTIDYPKNDSELQCFTTFYRQKRVFIGENLLNLGIKHSTSVLVQTFFAKFCTKFVTLFCVFKLFSTKNAENDYFNQRLGCTAPKRW